MNKLKSEKGAITLLVLVTMLFIISFLITTHIIVSNKYQVQLARSREISKVYNNVGDAENAYQGLFSSDPIKIKTVEELLKIGSGETRTIDEKMYVFSTDAAYILMNDISFKESDYTGLLDSQEWTPIGDRANIKFDGNGHTIVVLNANGKMKIYNEQNGYSD